MARLSWHEECVIGVRIAALVALLVGEMGVNVFRAFHFALTRNRIRREIGKVLFG